MIGLTGPRDGGKYLFHGFDFSVLSFEDMLALKMDFPSVRILFGVSFQSFAIIENLRREVMTGESEDTWDFSLNDFHCDYK